MLFLLFQLGEDRYAIEATAVVEVLPIVQMKAIPQAPTGIAGLINYRGTPVPVVDLCAWALQRPAQRRMSTRLIVVQAEGAPRHLALLAEQATDSVRLEPSQFVPSGVTTAEARYLGPVATDANGKLIQRVELAKLLPSDVREALALAVTEPV